MKKNNSVAGSAALLIPVSVFAGIAYSFEQQIQLISGLMVAFLGLLGFVLPIPIGVAVITFAYIKLTVD